MLGRPDRLIDSDSGLSSSRAILPAPALRPYVRTYIVRDLFLGSEPVHRPLTAQADPLLTFALGADLRASGGTGGACTLPRALLVGARSMVGVGNLEFSGHFFGFSIHFQPGGLYRLLGIPGCEVVEDAYDAESVIGTGMKALLEQLRDCARNQPMNCGIPEALGALVDCHLLPRLQDVRPVHAVLRAANQLRSTHGIADVGKLAAASGNSVRHFDRAFGRQFGISPKRYALIARCEFALRIKRQQPFATWAQISQEAGYFDQNHLVKDFRALFGASPSAYLRELATLPEPVYAGVQDGTPLPGSGMESARLDMSSSY